MNAIAAVSLDWGIGQGNGLLFHISEDMRRFRALTTGGTVLMGRRTLDSMPNGRPLPQRRNIVLTRQPDFHREGVEVVHSIEDALALAGEDAWVIGGGEIYAALLPYCRRCYITRVYAQPACDTFFPDLDRLPQWRLFRSEPVCGGEDPAYQFVEYVQPCPAGSGRI